MSFHRLLSGWSRKAGKSVTGTAGFAQRGGNSPGARACQLCHSWEKMPYKEQTKGRRFYLVQNSRWHSPCWQGRHSGKVWGASSLCLHSQNAEEGQELEPSWETSRPSPGKYFSLLVPSERSCVQTWIYGVISYSNHGRRCVAGSKDCGRGQWGRPS